MSETTAKFAAKPEQTPSTRQASTNQWDSLLNNTRFKRVFAFYFLRFPAASPHVAPPGRHPFRAHALTRSFIGAGRPHARASSINRSNSVSKSPTPLVLSPNSSIVGFRLIRQSGIQRSAPVSRTRRISGLPKPASANTPPKLFPILVLVPDLSNVSTSSAPARSHNGISRHISIKPPKSGSWNPTMPPGFTCLATDRTTCAGSRRNIRMYLPTAASNGLSNSTLSRSASTNRTCRSPSAAIRASARAIDRASLSTPTTSPDAPTNLAANTLTSPTPEPTSITRWPAQIPICSSHPPVRSTSHSACRISL